jgi:gamma-glutamyltranspeptidase/glutathione hydrolase
MVEVSKPDRRHCRMGQGAGMKWSKAMPSLVDMKNKQTMAQVVGWISLARYQRQLAIALLALCSLSAQAASSEPAWGRDGMVVTSVGPAAAAGKMMLERGGNAADAAIATAFAAAVAHPFSSGLGGGLMAVIHDAKTGQSITLDARETAPASASAEFYRNNPEAIQSGRYSVAVPGFVQGVFALHERFG